MDIVKMVYGSGDVTLLMMILNVFLGLTLSMTICYVYRITFRGTTYSQTFLLSLVMITIVTSVLISVIGSNLARAFSLVGALSIIRYRTAIKDARDTGFIFWSVATAMVIGAGYYLVAVGLVVLLSIILVVLDRINFACDAIHRNVIRVSLSMDKDLQQFEQQIMKILNFAYREVSLIEHLIDKTKKQMILTFVGTNIDSGKIKDKQLAREQRVIEQIKELPEASSVSVVSDHNQQNI